MTQPSTRIKLTRIVRSVALLACLAGSLTIRPASAAPRRWMPVAHGGVPVSAHRGQSGSGQLAAMSNGQSGRQNSATGAPGYRASGGRRTGATLPAGLRAALAHLHLGLRHGGVGSLPHSTRWGPRPSAARPSCACGGGGGPTWSQQAELNGTDYTFELGWSVALSTNGNMALVGAPQQNNGSGEAYVFVNNGSSWLEAAILSASDGTGDDAFGSAVALSSDGSTLLIGADGHNGGGAAYVFTPQPYFGYIQRAELTAWDGGGYFGSAVALSSDGHTALIGAIGHNGNSGAAYAFVGSGSSWVQEPELTAADAVGSDDFGWSVALSGDGNTALIGAVYKNNSTGAAYVFGRSGATWSQQAKLTASNGTSDDYFGSSVALSSNGSTALIGAYGANNGTGAGYVFVQFFGWSQQAELTAAGGAGGDGFGMAVALSGDGGTALIGAPYANYIGAAYIFQGSWSNWTQAQALTAADGGWFGMAVALNGDGGTALIGAPESNCDWYCGGAAYIFSTSAPPPPTPTNTPVPPTTTPVPPTATSTPVPPTNTPTSTPIPPTSTPVPPTATSTPVPPTSTPMASASINLSRSSGHYKDPVTVSGSGFGPSETVNVYLDTTASTPLTSTSSTAGGALSATFSGPQAISGTHTILAVGQSSGRSATAPFVELPGAYLLSYQGNKGTVDVLKGTGFAAHETVVGYWNSTSGVPFTVTATTNSIGTFGGSASYPGITFTVPLSPTGQYPVYAVGQSSHGVAHATFTLTPALSVKPSSAHAGATVTVSGTGYGANETVSIKYNCGTSGCSSTTILATLSTDGNGYFSVPVTLPGTTSVGTHALGGKGNSSGVFATTALSIS